MNRLTMMDSQGNWRLKGVEWRQLQEGEIITRHMAEKLYGALYKLKAYEDTGLMPEQIVEMDMLYAEKCKELAERSKGWIPVEEEFPETDKYILLSFSNFSIPCVGRYEEDENGGAFYVGDDDETCVSQDMFVNAWMNLPAPYQPKGE